MPLVQEELKIPAEEPLLLLTSIESSLKSLRFRAIKQTLNLLSSNLNQVLKEPAESLISLYQYISHLSEFRKVFYSQYSKNQRLRIFDVLKSIEIARDAGSSDKFVIYFSECMESLARFLQYDFKIWKGLNLSQSQPNTPEFAFFETIYSTSLANFEKLLKRRFQSKADFKSVLQLIQISNLYTQIFEKLNTEYIEELSSKTGVDQSQLQKFQKCAPISKIHNLVLDLKAYTQEEIARIENELMAVEISKEISPSFWSETDQKLTSLTWFFQNSIDKTRAVTMLTTLRPLMNLALRFRSEKVLLQSKVESFRFVDKMMQKLVHGQTKIVVFLPQLDEKLKKLINQSVQEILEGVKIGVNKKIQAFGKGSEEVIFGKISLKFIDFFGEYFESNLFRK